MSIKYNGKTVASNYKISASTTASDTKAGPIKIATEQELKDTTNNKVAVTPYLLNKALNNINRGLKIGRIGIGFINESQQQERYLNGQVIIQDQFESFATWVKDLIKLYPNLSCTNEEFENTCTLSAFGQCGKFVVDDNAGSIRLPKVVNIQGLFDLTQAGLTVEAGLPQHTHTRGTMNITGSFDNSGLAYEADAPTGAFYTKATRQPSNQNRDNVGYTYGFEASRSWTGSTSNANYTSELETTNTVQQEAVQYPYHIVVATGVETDADITNEIELNNPFFFGMSQYFEVEPNNISWLKSVGQWNSKAVYTDYYDWLLAQRNKGYKQLYGWSFSSGSHAYTLSENPSVGDVVFGYTPLYSYGVITAVNGTEATIKNIAENTNSTVTRDAGVDKIGYIAELSDVAVRFPNEITSTNRNYNYDYDFVINTAEETFRLPLKTKLASGKAVVGNGMSLGFTNGNNNYGVVFGTNGGPYSDKEAYGTNVGTAGTTGESGEAKSFGITTDPIKSGIETSDSGLHLYFYVGETVQNANLVNLGRVEEKVASLIPDNSSLISGYAMPSGKYIDLTLGASNTEYTAPANGYFAWFGFIKGTVGYFNLVNKTHNLGTQAYSAYNSDSGIGGYCFVPTKKGDNVCPQYYANTSITTTTFRFIYAVGSESEA